MKSLKLVLILTLGLSLMMFAVIGCDDDDDDNTVAPPVETISDHIVGTWLSAGDNLAPLLAGDPFNLDSIIVTFGEDQTIVLEQRSTVTEAWTTSNGTWVVDEETFEGEIFKFTGDYSTPVAFTQVGICSVVDDVFMLEAVQTVPDVGAPVPTVDLGFGGTVFASLNVQTYVRTD
jgi:hypothetical protein